MLLVIGWVTLGVAVACGWWVWWQQPPCLRHRVIVNLRSTDDEAYLGVLWRMKGSWLVLRDVSIIRPDAQPTKMDGEQVIDRANVAFVQVMR